MASAPSCLLRLVLIFAGTAPATPPSPDERGGATSGVAGGAVSKFVISAWSLRGGGSCGLRCGTRGRRGRSGGELLDCGRRHNVGAIDGEDLSVPGDRLRVTGVRLSDQGESEHGVDRLWSLDQRHELPLRRDRVSST